MYLFQYEPVHIYRGAAGSKLGGDEQKVCVMSQEYVPSPRDAQEGTASLLPDWQKEGSVPPLYFLFSCLRTLPVPPLAAVGDVLAPRVAGLNRRKRQRAYVRACGRGEFVC